ncbi:hypothetical protein WAI453_004335 [Rhynchosporium graminicola]
MQSFQSAHSQNYWPNVIKKAWKISMNSTWDQRLQKTNSRLWMLLTPVPSSPPMPTPTFPRMALAQLIWTKDSSLLTMMKTMMRRGKLR